MNTENITIEGFGKASRGFDNAETTVIMNTNAQPLAWDGIAGCRSFSNPVTVSEAAAEVGANYEVKKHHLISISDELYEAITNHTPLTQELLSMDNIVSSHMATVREDSGKVLGVVGKDYGVVQNAKALEFINFLTSGEINGGEKAVIETAGILDGGARFYMTAKLPNNTMIPGDKYGIENYIVFTTSHDGSGSVQAFFSPIRIICKNSLFFAMRKAKNKISFRHTSRVNERMEWNNADNRKFAIQTLQMQKHFNEEFIKEIMIMKEIKLKNHNDITKFCSRLFSNPSELKLITDANFNIDIVDELSTRKKNLIHDMENSIISSVGQNEHTNTGLWLFNGVTSYFQNVKKWKNNEDKFDSMMNGYAYSKIQDAHNLIMEMA